MKVTLIDNASVICQRIAEVISETAGIDLSTCAPDQKHVFSRVQEQHPDVVVLDVHICAGGALELIRHIKSIEAAPVVIALSATPSLQYRALCHRAGAEYFFDLVREQDRLTEALQALKEELGC